MSSMFLDRRTIIPYHVGSRNGFRRLIEVRCKIQSLSHELKEGLLRLGFIGEILSHLFSPFSG